MVQNKIKVLYIFFLMLVNFNVGTIYADTPCDNGVGPATDCISKWDYGFSSNSLTVDANKNKWFSFAENIYTFGNKASTQNNDVVISVAGSWNPWSYLPKYKCNFKVCSDLFNTDTCLPDGRQLIKEERQRNLPCCLNEGHGLYGLIAIEQPGNQQYADPNDNERSSSGLS